MAKTFPLSELPIVVFLSIKILLQINTLESIGIIFKGKGPVIVFIYNKYVSNQDTQIDMCIIKSFIFIAIEVGC